MKLLLIIILCLVILFLCYGPLPTVFIRLSKLGIYKTIPGKQIALTFDDGPHGVYTPQLLDLLKKYHVKATFFVVGDHVRRNPQIVKRMADEGHTIGIHHNQHVSNWLTGPLELKKQLTLANQAIEEATGEPVQFYRPPWGHFNLFTLFVGKKYKKIMWSHIFGDWKVEKARNGLLEELKQYASPGSIFVLHDNGDTQGAEKEAPSYMLRNLELFLEDCHEKNIEFITLKDVLE